VNWEHSYKYGKQKEEITREYFAKDISSSKGRYDFFDDETNYELKSRTNTKDCYPTTMITKDKVEDCDKDLKLLFHFALLTFSMTKSNSKTILRNSSAG
jgi:hypothetical protein